MTCEDFIASFPKKYITTSSFLSGLVILLVDLFDVMLCFGISFFVINLIDMSLISFRSFITYWVYLPVFLTVFYISKLYPGLLISPSDEVRRLAIGCACCFTGIAISIIIETDDRGIISLALLLCIPISWFVLPFGREAARKLFSRFFWWGVPTVIYCDGTDGIKIIDRLLNNPDLGYKPAAVIHTDGAEQPDNYRGIPVFQYENGIHDAIRRLRLKTAILIETAQTDIQTTPYLTDPFVLMQYRYVIVIPFKQNWTNISLGIRDFGGILGYYTTHNLTKKTNLALKRLIDLFLCLLFALPTLLVTVCIAVIIKKTSPGPVFYGHTRVGKNGRPFKTWKFRSMCVDADAQLQNILASDPVRRAEWEKDRKFTNDPRVTPFGYFLRKTSLDELPQLWNIFIGQMSLIGPRPVTQSELSKYGDKTPFILSVKPGLSGMWQVSGRSDTEYEDRVHLDSYYIQNWSIWLDIWILVKTVWVVLKGRGAY